MKKLISDIKSLPYFKNHSAVSGKVHNIASHEDAVEDLFLSHGMTKSETTKISKKERDMWLADNESCQTLKEGEYISQPCGTHNSPDFIIKKDGKLLFLECKSANGATPMYNSGIPKDGYIYIFCSKKHDETTVYLGEDVCPPDVQQLLHDHIKKQREQDEKLNKKIRELNHYGIEYYTRPMIQHKGGAAKTDYFVNENRNQNEKNVERFVNG